MKITNKQTGRTAEIKINKMTAMEGWNIQRRFVEFAMSKDPAFRSEYTMEVLSFAKVELDVGQEIPLSTGALIDNHLGDWENLKEVFEAVLMENGINPDTHAEREGYWEQAGGEMAAAFIGESMRLIAPFLSGETPNKG